MQQMVSIIKLNLNQNQYITTPPLSSRAQMQEISFSVNRSIRPWSGQRRYVQYSATDCVRIEMGIKMMLTVVGAKKQLLIPLTPLPDGRLYYMALIRDERTVKMVQYRLEINATGVFYRVRAVEVSDGVKAEYPHITFRTERVDMFDNERLFWKVFGKAWETVYQTINLSNPQHVTTGVTSLSYDVRRDTWTPPPAQRLVMTYGIMLLDRINITLREICGAAQSSAMMVRHGDDNRHFIALIRNGSLINAVDVQVIFYPDMTFSEHMIVYPANMVQLFPGFQFQSIQLTDAEKNTLVQEPVLRHYQTKNERYFMENYRIPRLTALAMCFHDRLGATSGIGALDREVVVLIAGMTP